jgi:hypothetical protein
MFCLLVEDFSKYICLLLRQCNCVRDVSDCRSVEDVFMDILCSMSTVLTIVGSWKYYVINIIYTELSMMQLLSVHHRPCRISCKMQEFVEKLLVPLLHICGDGIMC